MAAQLRRTPFSAFLPPGWGSSLLFLAVFAVYARTLNPSLFRNDSPETTTACLTLGVSHPPGYPLHTLLGRLFAMAAPIGNAAMTLNFFSAFLGALGACLLAVNLWLMLGSSSRPYRMAAAFTGALAFAFSKSYWSASLAAKGGIYVMQVDLELAFFYFLQLHFLSLDAGPKIEGGVRRPHALLALIFTLGLTNHWPTQALTLPALCTLALVKAGTGAQPRFKPTAKSLAQNLGFALLVLGLYLYLPLRASQFPALNFGAPLNGHRFLACLLRADYSKVETMASAAPAEFSALGNKALYLSYHFLNEFNALFLLFAALGVWGLLKKSQERSVLFLLTLLLTTHVANLFYLRVDPIEFWHLDDHTLSLNWVLGIFGGVGVGEALLWLGTLRFFKNRAVGRRAVYLLVAAVFPLLLIFKHHDVNDQSREFLYWGYGMTALKSMDHLAVYYAESDYDYFSILYLKAVESKRPDVTLYLAALLGKDYSDLTPLQAHKAAIPLPLTVFEVRYSAERPELYCAFANGQMANARGIWGSNRFYFKPAGILIHAFPAGPGFDTPRQMGILRDFWQHYLAPEQQRPNPINALLVEFCAHPYLNAADYLRLKGDLSQWDDLYEKGLSLIQENPWRALAWETRAEGDAELGKEKEAAAAYTLAALQYQSVGRTEEARSSLKKALALDPFNAELQRALAGLDAP